MYNICEHCRYNILNHCEYFDYRFPGKIPAAAIAYVKGNPSYPGINGTVSFKNVSNGCEVSVNIEGLPPFSAASGNKPQIGPFGFHIHKFPCGDAGNPNDPFPASDGHWNPTNQPHGNHAGDFPVLFSNDGISKMTFFTNRFKVRDIINKSVVIHESPDDYRTQPSGNSGKKIACGTIVNI